MTMTDDAFKYAEHMARANRLGEKIVVGRGPVNPFAGRPKVYLLLRNFKVVGLPDRSGRTVPIGTVSFEALKKYVYVFSHEFGQERMGHIVVPEDRWGDFCAKLGIELPKPKCYLVLDEDVADVAIPRGYVTTRGDKPLADLTEEEATMTPEDRERAGRETMGEEFLQSDN